MSWTKWNAVAVCLLSVCSIAVCSSSGSSKSDGNGSTSTTIATAGLRHRCRERLESCRGREIPDKSVEGRGGEVEHRAGAASTPRAVPPPRAQRLPAVRPGTVARRCACRPPRKHTTEPFVAFVNGTDTDQWVVVGAVADGVKRVSIGFADGTRTPLNIDPKSRLVIWKGPASVKPKDIKADSVTCTIDPAEKTSKTAAVPGREQ